jgi:hypothetical protein
MDAKEARAREIQGAIHAVLLDDWDPIGVKDEPFARDEYASYVGRVYHALAAGASAEDIASVLAKIELESMGLRVSAAQLIGVARKLRALDVRLG